MKQLQTQAPRSVEARMALRRERMAEQRRRVEAVGENLQSELVKFERFVEVTVPQTLAQIQVECEAKLQALTLRHHQQVTLIEQAEIQVYQALAAEVFYLVQEVMKLDCQLESIKGDCQSIEGELDSLRIEQEKTKQQLNDIAWEMKRRKKRRRLQTIRTVSYVALAIGVNYILPPEVGVSFAKGCLRVGVAV